MSTQSDYERGFEVGAAACRAAEKERVLALLERLIEDTKNSAAYEAGGTIDVAYLAGLKVALSSIQEAES